MKFLKASATAVMVGVSILGLSVAAPTQTQAQTAATSTPIDVWALRDVVNAVDLSPDGKHLLVHKVESREGDYLLEIYKTDDLSKPFRRLNADPMEITNARWVSNSIIFGGAWQIKRAKVKSQEQDVRNYASYFYDLNANKFQQIEGSFSIANELPDEPDRILIATGAAVEGGPGNDPAAAFRPRSYYKLNLKTGARELVLRGTSKYAQVTFDNKGNPRYAIGQDSDNTIKTFYRKPGDGSWKQFGEVLDQDDPDNLYRFLGGFQGIAGFSAEDPNLGYIIDARNGEDKAALWLFNFETGEFVEKMFQSEDSDVMGIGLHSIPGNDKLAFASYPGAKMERHWFDEDEKALVRGA